MKFTRKMVELRMWGGTVNSKDMNVKLTCFGDYGYNGRKPEVYLTHCPSGLSLGSLADVKTARSFIEAVKGYPAWNGEGSADETWCDGLKMIFDQHK